MLHKADFFNKFSNVQEGMTVRCQDGDKLGKVSAMNDDSFTVQKGFFFPRDFMFRYDDIQDVRDEEIILNQCLSDIQDWKDESFSGWSQVDDINAGRVEASPREEYKGRYQDWDRYDTDRTAEHKTANYKKEDIKVPIVEEELQANKVMRQAGEVKLRKIVHTEFRHFTVPVTREEVRIERVPVSSTEAATDKTAFKEETINVPIMEEEVTISKRPVVKEEVRVVKEQVVEQRDVSGEVRKEEVKVEDQEALRRKKAG